MVSADENELAVKSSYKPPVRHLSNVSQDSLVHRVVPTSRETLKAAGGSVDVGDQLDNRVNTPMVLHHNRPML